jgi:hypothetical protein
VKNVGKNLSVRQACLLTFNHSISTYVLRRHPDCRAESGVAFYRYIELVEVSVNGTMSRTTTLDLTNRTRLSTFGTRRFSLIYKPFSKTTTKFDNNNDLFIVGFLSQFHHSIPTL